MATKSHRTGRRAEALSKERIVEAAIELLDAEGGGALTFRALTARLATGAGAIYWHVADKDELLAAAAGDVIARMVTEVADDAEPAETVRALALGIFDAIDAHPWVGAQLSRDPAQPAMLQIFERVGGQLQTLGVPEQALFDSASALVNYILGVAGQNAANARRHAGGPDRTAFLTNVAEQWTQHDPAKYPFLHRIAQQLREHDDREQYLAGIDLILTGIATLR